MKNNIVIIGAGPAGLALGYKLLDKNIKGKIYILEKENHVGGLAKSFRESDLFFDLGSHRLHPSTNQVILEDLHKLLGADLKNQDRNGRIRLKGTYVKFPLNLSELILKLPFSFSIGIIKDTFLKIFRLTSNKKYSVNFETTLLNSLGPTICEHFYFPYAKKLWGAEPKNISAIQAEKRISNNTVWKILKKIFLQILFRNKKTRGTFYYPKNGFGQISEAYFDQIYNLGGKVLLNTSIKKITYNEKLKTYFINYSNEKNENISKILEAKLIFSTIPISSLLNLLDSKNKISNLMSKNKLKHRSMVLLYIIFDKCHFTNFDAHYFPENDVLFSRISEPKNYSMENQSLNKTGICVEIPCQDNDEVWNSKPEKLYNQIRKQLDEIDLPINGKIRKFFTKKIKHVYPIYDLEYKNVFSRIEDYINEKSNLITLGRQGLFMHDNTHHTIDMAYKASECLDIKNNWDSLKWKRYRKMFDKNVVED